MRVKDFETYTQSGGTMSQKGYNSANMAADVGDNIRRYIQEIVTAAAAEKVSAASISNTHRAKDAQIAVMTMQNKILTDAIAALTMTMSNKENIVPKTGNAGTNAHTFNWMQKMGGYCFTWQPSSWNETHKQHLHPEEGGAYQ
jgi:hypothetical protein